MFQVCCMWCPESSWMSMGPSMYGTVPLQGLLSWHQCEGTEYMLGVHWMDGWCIVLYLIPRQLRFSLYSGAEITEGLM